MITTKVTKRHEGLTTDFHGGTRIFLDWINKGLTMMVPRRLGGCGEGRSGLDEIHGRLGKVWQTVKRREERDERLEMAGWE